MQGEVAAQLARGAARMMSTRCGVGTTGVAGPGPADGHEAGTVFVAACIDGEVAVRRLRLAGTRTLVRQAAVAAALAVLRGVVDDWEQSRPRRS